MASHSCLIKKYREWKNVLALHPDAIIHYNFPLSKASLLRDPWFMRYAGRMQKDGVHVHGGLFLTAPHIPGILMRIMKWVFGQDLPFIVFLFYTSWLFSTEWNVNLLSSRLPIKAMSLPMVHTLQTPIRRSLCDSTAHSSRSAPLVRITFWYQEKESFL